MPTKSDTRSTAALAGQRTSRFASPWHFAILCIPTPLAASLVKFASQWTGLLTRNTWLPTPAFASHSVHTEVRTSTLTAGCLVAMGLATSLGAPMVTTKFEDTSFRAFARAYVYSGKNARMATLAKLFAELGISTSAHES